MGGADARSNDKDAVIVKVFDAFIFAQKGGVRENKIASFVPKPSNQLKLKASQPSTKAKQYASNKSLIVVY